MSGVQLHGRRRSKVAAIATVPTVSTLARADGPIVLVRGGRLGAGRALGDPEDAVVRVGLAALRLNAIAPVAFVLDAASRESKLFFGAAGLDAQDDFVLRLAIGKVERFETHAVAAILAFDLAEAARRSVGQDRVQVAVL